MRLFVRLGKGASLPRSFKKMISLIFPIKGSNLLFYWATGRRQRLHPTSQQTCSFCTKQHMENYMVPFPRHRKWHCSSSSWLVPKRSKKSRKKRRLQNYRSSFCLRNTVGGANQIPTSSHLTHFPNYTFKRNMLAPWTRWTWWMNMWHFLLALPNYEFNLIHRAIVCGQSLMAPTILSFAQPCHTSHLPAGSECYRAAVARRHLFWDSITRDTRVARLFRTSCIVHSLRWLPNTVPRVAVSHCLDF